MDPDQLLDDAESASSEGDVVTASESLSQYLDWRSLSGEESAEQYRRYRRIRTSLGRQAKRFMGD